MSRWPLIACGVALTVLSPLPAAAQPVLETPRQITILLGPNIGGSFQKKSGTLLGAELSAVYLDNGLWFGFYTDTLHDLGLRRTRFSIGPEAGIGPFGFDVGYVREFGDKPMQGWRVRGILSAYGLISAYVGPGMIRSGDEKLSYREAGLLFKMPLVDF